MEKEVLQIMQRVFKDMYAKAEAGESMDIFAMQKPCNMFFNHAGSSTSGRECNLADTLKKPPDPYGVLNMMVEDSRVQNGSIEDSDMDVVEGGIPHVYS